MEHSAYYLVLRAVFAKGSSPHAEQLLLSLRQALGVDQAYHLECLEKLSEDNELEALKAQLSGAAPAAASKLSKGRHGRPDAPAELPPPMSSLPPLVTTSKTSKKGRILPAGALPAPAAGPPFPPLLAAPGVYSPHPSSYASHQLHQTTMQPPKQRHKAKGGSRRSMPGYSAFAVRTLTLPKEGEWGPVCGSSTGRTWSSSFAARMQAEGTSGRMPAASAGHAPAAAAPSTSSQQKLKRKAAPASSTGGKRLQLESYSTAPAMQGPPYEPGELAAALQRGSEAELRPMLAALETREQDLAAQIRRMGEELKQLFGTTTTPVVHLAGKRLDAVPYPPEVISTSLHAATAQQLEDMARALEQREQQILQEILAMDLPTTDDPIMAKTLQAAQLYERQDRILRQVWEIDNELISV